MTRAAWRALAATARALVGLLTAAGCALFRAGTWLAPTECAACGRCALGLVLPDGWTFQPSHAYRGALVACCPTCAGCVTAPVRTSRGHA